ncbi:MAG: nucleotidyltransferase family protein [Phycisphaerae bacterium]|nr:nucleotidyltransferase family protein [Phycisphaerae bacterium]
MQDAIRALDRGSVGIVLVVDSENRLQGTITDGDIRRALLTRSNALELPAGEFVAEKHNEVYVIPVTVPQGSSHAAMLQLMHERVVSQLPVLDEQGRVLDLVIMDDLISPRPPMRALIMAGGFGQRLMPLTENTPKPMLSVGGQPLLEKTIKRLRDISIENITISTHFQAEKIRGFFGDGSELGLNIDYIHESHPLGTAGALGLMEPADEALLVMNGDILTSLDFNAMLQFHREHDAMFTMGVRQYDVEIPYGVVECDYPIITDLQEKPVFTFFINAGIYLLEPKAHQLVPRELPKGQKFNMTDLIHLIRRQGQPVCSFPIFEYWLDIGKHSDYVRAQQDVQHV